MEGTILLRAWADKEIEASNQIDLTATSEIQRMKKEQMIDLEIIYRNVVWDKDVRRFFAILLLKEIAQN